MAEAARYPSPPLSADELEGNSLKHLLGSLKTILANKSLSRDNVNGIIKSMEQYKSNIDEWGTFAHWDDAGKRYTRNLVDDGNGLYNILILCWPAGVKSAIHDHPNSHCVMKILQGEMVENRYEFPDNIVKTSSTPVLSSCGSRSALDEDGKRIVQTASRTLGTDAVAYMHDEFGVHQMANCSDRGTVSLHIYSPPIPACKIFDPESGSHQHVNSNRIDSKDGKPIVCIE